MGDKGTGKDVEHYLKNTNLTLTGSGVHHRVRIDIEPERLLQGLLLAGHTRRNTQKSAGNKKMHSYKNVMWKSKNKTDFLCP